jgi:cytochrome b561
MGYIAPATHWALYFLVAATVVLGIANAWIRGDTILGLFAIPSPAPGNKALKGLVEYLHATSANVLLIVAGLHALTGLVHRFLLGDGVLRRMLPRRE